MGEDFINGKYKDFINGKCNDRNSTGNSIMHKNNHKKNYDKDSGKEDRRSLRCFAGENGQQLSLVPRISVLVCALHEDAQFGRV